MKNKMKAVLTGGAGFIGHHLTQFLLSKNYSVVCIDDLSTGTQQNIKPFLSHPDYLFIHSNARYVENLAPEIKTADLVFNLAASVGVQNVFQNPILCMENNIDVAKAVLQLAEQYKVRTFMFSTSEVYGKTQKFPFQEEDDCTFGSYKSLRWGYAASKLIDDYMTRAYFESYKTPVTTIRLFNTIGINQVGHYGMVVPRLFDQALKNEPITVFGTGQQTRCFTDVRDVISAIASLIDCKEAYGELVNIGSQNEISISDLANEIKTMTNSHSEIIIQSYQEAYGAGFEDIQKRTPDCTKLLTLTGFKPVFTLNDSLSWIYNDLKATAANKSVEISPTLEQNMI